VAKIISNQGVLILIDFGEYGGYAFYNCQHERSDHAVFAIGPYTIQPSAKILINKTDNKKVSLTDKVAAILKYLYRVGA
jgi:DNA-binding response OmpR family regulator